MKRGMKLLSAALALLLCASAAWAAPSRLTQPAGLLEIDEAAFEGASAARVELPEGMRAVGARAFADSALRRVYLPDSVEEIAPDAFEGCEGLCAYVHSGSYARKWCRENGVPCVILGKTAWPVWAASVRLSTNALRLAPGESATLDGTVLPEDATEPGLTFSSANPKVATVDGDGVVTAVGLGKAKIVARSLDGGARAVCQVVVMGKATYRALLVGNSDYATPLHGPDNDLLAMRRMLAGTGMGFQITAQADVTGEELFDLFAIAFDGATDDDISLFYYSGHGVTDAGEYYSGALKLVDYSYITTADLAELVTAIPGRVIVILDSCGSGAAISDEPVEDHAVGAVESFDPDLFNKGLVRAMRSAATRRQPIAPKAGELRSERLLVLTGSAYEEDSLTTTREGVWGGLLTKGITKGAGFDYLSDAWNGSMPADRDGDGCVSLAECAAYCQSYVGDRQHVLCWPEGSDQTLWWIAG